MDPLGKKFPFYSPYQYAGNKIICSVDIDGLEDIHFIKSLEEANGGKNGLEIQKGTEIGNEIISGTVTGGGETYLAFQNYSWKEAKNPRIGEVLLDENNKPMFETKWKGKK